MEEKVRGIIGNVFIAYVSLIILLLSSMLPVTAVAVLLALIAGVAGYFCNKQFIKQFTIGMIILSCIVAGLSAQNIGQTVFTYLGSLVRAGILSL